MKYNIYQVQKEYFAKTIFLFIKKNEKIYKFFNIFSEKINVESIDNSLWTFGDEFFPHAKNNDSDLLKKNTNTIIYDFKDFLSIKKDNSLNIFLIFNGTEIELSKEFIKNSLENKNDTLVIYSGSYNEILLSNKDFSEIASVYKMNEKLKWIEVFKNEVSIQ